MINWKYILIVVILATFVSGGILGYQWWIEKQEITIPEVKIPSEVTEKEAETLEVEPETKTPEEKKLEEERVKDPVSNIEIIARENELDVNKTDIFIKDLKTEEEKFFITLAGIDRDYLKAEFRNNQLYIVKGEAWNSTQKLWRYSSDGGGRLLFKAEIPEGYSPHVNINDFKVAPNNNFVAVAVPSGVFQDALVIVDLVTSEQKEFSASELTANEIWSKWQQRIMQPSIWVRLFDWPSDSEYFWGVAYFITSADPSVPNGASIFKINLDNWEIEKFLIPRLGRLINYFSSDNINLEKEAILFEQENNGIYLYLYNFHSKKEETIISYSKEVLDEYFHGEFWIYVVEGALPQLQERQLSPKWIDYDTISYLDLITREEVIKKLE